MLGFYSRNHRAEKTENQDNGEVNKSSEEHPLLKYGVRSYFERELLDTALMVGMTPDEFWYGDPELLYNYLRVYEKKEINSHQKIWALGVTIRNVYASTPVVAVLGTDKLIESMPDYPNMPYNEEKIVETDEEKKAKLCKVFESQLTQWVNSFKR